EQRYPRQIACGHSFCEECFDRYLQLSRETRCPLCRCNFQPVGDAVAPEQSLDHVTLPAAQEPDDGELSWQSDTLMLTLTEQECRYFDELYRETSRGR
ncbi:hypothetical protein KR018_002942, partial [Drosophila ironensis]